MPALFAYLVALTLLLGGGYAGLHWIASPDEVGTHQRIGEKPIARNMPKKSEKSEFNGDRAGAAPGEADGESQAGTTASVGPDVEPPQKPEPEANETATIATPGDPAPPAKTDDAAAGGCTPIGVTARGADVFPIPCQALIERRRGSAPSSPPPPAAPASGEVQAAELAKPMDSRAAMTGPAQPDRSSKNSANAGKQDKRQVKRHARSSRSRLVMMYMRTIEYPDGHREQQLLPVRPSRRMAVEAEDDW